MSSFRIERVDRGIKARSEDIYCLSSFKEMAYLALPRIIPVIALLLIPLILPIYWQRVWLSASILGLLAISWDFLASYAGLISLGHAFFFGAGAYVAGCLNFYYGVPPALSILAGTFSGAALSLLLLLPALRLRGIYFAMVSLVLPLIAGRIIEATGKLGGTEGLVGITPLPNMWIELYVVLIVLIFVLFAFMKLSNMDFGIVLQGIKENEHAVRSAGIDITKYKIKALFIAALPAAFAGAWLTHVYTFVGIPSFALDYSLMPIAATVLGGTGTLAGPIFGSFILGILSEILRGIGAWRIVAYSIIIVVFVVLRPQGLYSLVRRKYHQIERKVEL